MSAVPAGYKQTEAGVIPADWEVSSLTKVADVRGGVAKNSNVAISDPISVHYLRVANVQDGFLDLADMSEIEISRQDLKRYSVLPGDVLMNEGGDLDKLGRGAIWNGEFSPCVHQNHVFVVRCKSQLLPQYLDVWTGTQPARRFFLLAGKQTTNLASISKSSLGELPVALPSLAEQRAIAAALSDVDALLAKFDQLITKKRDLKQAAMQQLLTGQTRLPGYGGKWDVKGLRNFVTQDRFAIVDGPFGSQLKVDEYVEIGVPVIEMEHLCDDFVTERIERCITPRKFEDLKRSAVYPGDIIVSKTGSLGKLGLIPAGVQRGLITSRLAKITIDPLRANRHFVFQCLLKLRHDGYWETVSQGGTMQILGIGMLQNAPIPGISIPEQTAIATVLDDMDAELAALEVRRDKTRALKQGMMQELLTGRIRLV